MLNDQQLQIAVYFALIDDNKRWLLYIMILDFIRDLNPALAIATLGIFSAACALYWYHSEVFRHVILVCNLDNANFMRVICLRFNAGLGDK